MSQDFQKREAKNSLWDMDGMHINKRWRNKGKGRWKDKRLAQSQLEEMAEQAELDHYDMINEEANEAWYCHLYGPCDRCKEKDNG